MFHVALDLALAFADALADALATHFGVAFIATFGPIASTQYVNGPVIQHSFGINHKYNTTTTRLLQMHTIRHSSDIHQTSDGFIRHSSDI